MRVEIKCCDATPTNVKDYQLSYSAQITDWDGLDKLRFNLTKWLTTLNIENFHFKSYSLACLRVVSGNKINPVLLKVINEFVNF